MDGNEIATMLCHGCGKQIKFPESKIGKAAKCPGCATVLTLRNDAELSDSKPLANAIAPAVQQRTSASKPPEKQSGSGKVFMIVGGSFFGLFLLCCGCGGLVALFDDSEPSSDVALDNVVPGKESSESSSFEVVSSPSLTKETFDLCQTGMSYDQVVAIVGPPESTLSETDIGGIRTIMYQWKGGFVANANMTFQDGKLVSKAQFGL